MNKFRQRNHTHLVVGDVERHILPLLIHIENEYLSYFNEKSVVYFQVSYHFHTNIDICFII